MVKLMVAVSAAVAVVGATGRAGQEVVTLSPEVLGALNELERALLAQVLTERHYGDERTAPTNVLYLALGGDMRGSALAMPTTDTSPEAVFEALRVALTKEAERRIVVDAKEREELNKAVALCLTAVPYLHHNERAPWQKWGLRPGVTLPERWVLGSAVKLGVMNAEKAWEARNAFIIEVGRLNREETRAVAQAWCDRPVAQRFYRCGVNDWRVCRLPIGWGAPSQTEREADEEYTKACPAYPAALAEAEAEAKRMAGEERARVDAQAAAVEARHEHLRAIWRGWALTHPELGEAARENYEIVGGVIDAVAGAVAEAASKVAGVVEVASHKSGTRAWELWEMEDRKAPRNTAIRAQKALAVAVADLAIPEGLTVTVERVQRVSVTIPRGEYCEDEVKRRTALVVQLTSEIAATRAVIAFLE